MSRPYASYLGDSVYADFDGYTITLTTENGFGPSNTIVLEPEVLAALNNYAVRVREMAQQEQQKEPK